MSDLDRLVADLRACRLCRDAPQFDGPLPHEPRPIIQASATARLCIASQAPGTLAHRSGKPFDDPSGRRLRAWLGLDEEKFYDASRVAIVPMGSCFPGQDAQGGDLPPRRECAPTWRKRLFKAMPSIEIVLLVGQYSQRWHLGDAMRGGLTATVANWRHILGASHRPRLLPMPHPSWRNNGWLKRNLWFESELLPALRAEVASFFPEARKDLKASTLHHMV
ncbi:MAG: uracil-DNA glycosylase family protein [Beijerinckiaceae bacterium]|nr:uracil-DNA glycosylase family protein [Beijerinckiaceae bacterium]